MSVYFSVDDDVVEVTRIDKPEDECNFVLRIKLYSYVDC